MKLKASLIQCKFQTETPHLVLDLRLVKRFVVKYKKAGGYNSNMNGIQFYGF
jgi:hypothetical protein